MLRQLLLLLLFSLPQTAHCATCRGAVLGSSLSSSSTTITSQSSTSVSFTGYNYNSAATKCHFKIQPTGNPQYIDISIENLPPFSGSLRFLTPESPTTSIILATQAANGVIKPFRAYSSTLTIEWDGTSDNLSQFSIRLSYSSPSYNPTVKGTGLNSENWPSHDPPYNGETITCYPEVGGEIATECKVFLYSRLKMGERFPNQHSYFVFPEKRRVLGVLVLRYRTCDRLKHLP